MSDYFLSDHCSLSWDLTVGKPTLPTKLISYRKIKAIDLQVLCEEMPATKLCQDSPNTLNDLVECYNLTLASILDRHAPLLTKTLTIRPLVPWFNNEIKKARRERRKADIRWGRTRSASHFKEFKAKKNHTTHLITKARRVILKDFIDRNRFNQKNLFSGCKRLLKQVNEVPFPPFKDKLSFANQMGSLFAEKIKTIHLKLDGLSSSLPVISNNNAKSWSGTWMDQFKLLSECEVRRLIESSAKKTCILDPMPTSLVIGCTQVLLPVLTKINNLSFQSGTFADNWKCALVNPLLKKPGLDLVFKNY